MNALLIGKSQTAGDYEISLWKNPDETFCVVMGRRGQAPKAAYLDPVQKIDGLPEWAGAQALLATCKHYYTNKSKTEHGEQAHAAKPVSPAR